MTIKVKTKRTFKLGIGDYVQFWFPNSSLNRLAKVTSVTSRRQFEIEEISLIFPVRYTFIGVIDRPKN